MAITVTAKSGMAILQNIGAMKIYDLTLDASWLEAGEAIDLTDDFSTIIDIKIGGQVAGIGANFQIKQPEDGEAVTASNVVLMAYYSTDAAGLHTAVPDTTDLSGINPLTITVIGKPAIES